jgi:hypothetical protein
MGENQVRRDKEMNLFLFVIAIACTGFMLVISIMHLRKKRYIIAVLYLAMFLFYLMNMYWVFG